MPDGPDSYWDEPGPVRHQLRNAKQGTIITVSPEFFPVLSLNAMCHHFQSGSVIGKSAMGVRGWNDFIKKNPGRIKK